MTDKQMIHAYQWIDPTVPDAMSRPPAIEVRIRTEPGQPPWMYLHELRRAFKEIAVALYEGDPCAPNACTCLPGRSSTESRG